MFFKNFRNGRSSNFFYSEEAIYFLFFIIILGLILKKSELSILYLKNIIPSLIPLIFIPRFYKELRKNEKDSRKCFKLIGISYGLLILLLINISFLGNQKILFFMLMIVMIFLALYKSKKVSKKNFIYSIAASYFIFFLIPIIIYCTKGG